MDFNKLLSKKILVPLMLVILAIGLILWRVFSKTDYSASDGIAESPDKTLHSLPPEGRDSEGGNREIDLSHPLLASPVKGEEYLTENDAAIQKQFDRDRQQQKMTKDLKNKLEQTNLELEQEKAISEINKLKKQDVGEFNEPSRDAQNNLPEIKVEYIGGNSVKKEAILSIAGTTFQVKEKSIPTDNIQVVSISDTGVTLHFSAPQQLTKTIDYKPE